MDRQIRESDNRTKELEPEGTFLGVDSHTGISARGRFALLALIMVGVSAITMSIISVILYRHAFDQQEQKLRETVQSQADLIRAVALYNESLTDVLQETNRNYDHITTTINLLGTAHRDYQGFGHKSMEFTVARRQGNEIVFLFRHRDDAEELPKPIPISSELAEPQRRALRGESGSMRGLDYRGHLVLAAYQPVKELDIGIVAKIDVAEIRTPFFSALLAGGIISIFCILLGTMVFFKVSNPVIRHLERSTANLKAEVEQRRKTEVSLKKAKDYAESLIETANTIVVVLNIEGHIQVFNKTAQDITGYSFEELKDKNWFEVLVPRDRFPQVWSIFGKMVSEGIPDTFENPILTKTGEVRYISWQNSTLAESGKIIGTVSFGMDITRRKKTEEEHRLLTHQLAAKNEELEQIIYVASHDLRSPLVNIDGYSKEIEYTVEDLTQILSNTPATKGIEGVKEIIEQEIPQAIKFIRTSSAKMDKLLSGLLHLSRTGRASLHIECVNMKQLMSEVVDSFEFQIKTAGVQLIIEDLPTCQADRDQLNQVFSNLLDNALKYLDPDRAGSIRITGKAEKDQSVYCFEDNGIGIDPQHLSQIFEIFHRLTPTHCQGEGLGLTIVKRITGRLKGSVEVESTPGVGSRFMIAFPAGE